LPLLLGVPPAPDLLGGSGRTTRFGEPSGFLAPVLEQLARALLGG
jgi:hypothetical protein